MQCYRKKRNILMLVETTKLSAADKLSNFLAMKSILESFKVRIDAWNRDKHIEMIEDCENELNILMYDLEQVALEAVTDINLAECLQHEADNMICKC
jgi:hypothetical protein